MRREWRWALVIVIALAVGATCAESYARLAAPYYITIADLISEMHPWKILSVVVAEDESSHGAVLRLTGEVRRRRDDLMPAARVVGRVQVGEAIETPIVFWTILLLWPTASVRQRLGLLAAGVPIFLCLEAATTGVQLVHSMAEASALLGGDNDPLTVWERWSRFLEGGGRFVIEVAAALVTVALAELKRPQIRKAADTVPI